MKESSEILDELKGRNPFRVPDGYFENFAERMMAKLPEKEIVVAKKISMYDRVKPWLYMAASFVALIVLFNTLNKMNGSATKNGIISDNVAGLAATPSTASVDDSADFLEYVEEMYVDKYAYTDLEDLF